MRSRSEVSKDATIAAVFALSPAEKMQLVQDLWGDLASNPENLPVPDWHIEELDRRMAYLEAHPESAMSWEEAMGRAGGGTGPQGGRAM